MHAYSVSYTFNQLFPVSARKAYDWSTDYQPNDLALMGEEGKRRIRRVTEDAIILEEDITQEGKRIRKAKLVRLNSRTLSWHNIQLQGPNRYSEFLYEILPDGNDRSRLTFTGLLVVYNPRRLSSRRLRQIADREKRYDSRSWKLLAKAMANDHRKRKRP